MVARILLALAAVSWFLDGPRLAAEPPTAAGRIDFSRDIRPILSDNCFYCHGPDEKRREADLRLDTHQGALTAVTPGDNNASKLIHRITSDDIDERMPPARANRQLTAEQVVLLRQWIDEGAPGVNIGLSDRWSVPRSHLAIFRQSMR